MRGPCSPRTPIFAIWLLGIFPAAAPGQYAPGPFSPPPLSAGRSDERRSEERLADEHRSEQRRAPSRRGEADPGIAWPAEHQPPGAADGSVSPAGERIAVRYQDPSATDPPVADPPATEPTSPEDRPPLTTIESVTKRLEQVQANAAVPEETRQRLVETLTGILDALRRRAAETEEAASHQQAIDDVGERLTRVRAGAERPVEPVGGPPAFLPIGRVREGKAEADAELAAAREQLQRTQRTIQERQTIKETLPTQIQEQRNRIAELEATAVPVPAEDPDGELLQARQALRAAEIEAARARLQKLNRYQQRIEAESELLPLEEQAARNAVQRAEAEAKAWSEALSRRRESQLQEELRSYRQALEQAGIDPQTSLVLGRDELREHWLYVVGETAAYEQLVARETSQVDAFRETLSGFQEQIREHREAGRSLGGSLGLRLRLEKNSLPPIRQIQQAIREIDDKIERAELRRSDATLVLESARRMGENDRPIKRVAGLPMLDDGVHPTEIRLLEQYLEDIRRYNSALINLRATLVAKREAVDQLRATIDAHILWVPNHPRFRLRELQNAWVGLERILHPAELKRAAQAAFQGLLGRPDLLLLAVLSVGMLVFGGPRIRRRLSALGKAASPMQVVSLRPTATALLLTILQAVPLPLLLWTLAQAIRSVLSGKQADVSVAPGLELAATIVLPLELLRQIIRPNGLLTAHFGVADATVRSFRFGLRVLIDVGLPLVVVWSVTQQFQSSGIDSSLGRVVFCLGMILLSYATWSAVRTDKGLFSRMIAANPGGWLARLKATWLPPLCLFPLVLAGLSLAGFSFGAESLLQSLFGTLWFGIGTLVAFGFTRRWLLTQRRRLAVTARAKRLEAIEAGLIEPGEASEETLDVSEINAQTSRLLGTVFVLVVLIGLAGIWSPVFPAIDYLERYPLPGQARFEPADRVTWASVLRALPVIILAWVAVRNLPGLMEGLLLDRLPLQRAARYAITSLTTYTLSAIGLIWVAQTLQFRWESIQWLVAALGVGLGFGLQEIFANFVSGLILLFEQPIRVGDIVTVGDTTGTVSKIKIRATTVTNWDRHELVIPNKDLITGRLINWTLSDSLNRVVVEVGVAYGSDTRLACQILKEIALAHPQLSEDPGPIVTFEGFGDSTLNLVLRCYLPSLDNRLGTIHDLHTAIDDRFREAGIEIAFPQRDLHLRSIPAELLPGQPASTNPPESPPHAAT